MSLDGVTTTPTAPSVEVISSQPGEIVLRVTTPGSIRETVVHDTMEFQRITAPGCCGSPDVGYACVLLVGHLIAVPEGAEIEIAVAATETVRLTDVAVYPTPALGV